MSIAGSVGGEVKTAMTRVVQPIPANGTKNESSEGVRVENGEGDREILGVQVTARTTDADDLGEEDSLHLTADGGMYFGANDSKPGENEYVDEANYLGRFQYTQHYETRYDSSNTASTGAGAIEMGPTYFLEGDETTRVWNEGVTLSFVISSVTSFADMQNTDSADFIVDFVVYYKEL